MKLTIGNIAAHYGLNRETISRYKNSGNPNYRRRYEALKAYFENPPIGKPLTEMTREELFALHERISERVQDDADTLQVIADLLHH